MRMHHPILKFEQKLAEWPAEVKIPITVGSRRKKSRRGRTPQSIQPRRLHEGRAGRPTRATLFRVFRRPIRLFVKLPRNRVKSLARR